MGGGGGESKSSTTYGTAAQYMPAATLQSLESYSSLPTSQEINYGGGKFQMPLYAPLKAAQTSVQAYSPTPVSQTSSETQMPSFCGGACFMFNEAERDEKLKELRKFRDTYFPRGCTVQSGYSKMSRFIIPIMKRFKPFKLFMKLILTKPLIAFAKNHYGKNRYGIIFYPLAWMWRNVWWCIGKFIPMREYTWAEFYAITGETPRFPV